jgi:hypothetical protein
MYAFLGTLAFLAAFLFALRHMVVPAICALIFSFAAMIYAYRKKRIRIPKEDEVPGRKIQ